MNNSNYSIMSIANRILDEIALILIKVDDVDPKCIAQLNLDTDVMNCLKLSTVQLLLFKFYLEKTYGLPFNLLEIDREQLTMKELITYIFVHSDDSMIDGWLDIRKIA